MAPSNRTAVVQKEVLERERARLAWSVEMLAEKSGLSIKTIRRILKGKPAYLSTIRAIAALLGTSADLLLFREAPKLPRFNYYDIRVRTVGVIANEEQFSKFLKILNDLVLHLNAEDIQVTSQDSNISLSGEKPPEFIVMSIESHAIERVDGIKSAYGANDRIPPWTIRAATFYVLLKTDRLAEFMRVYSKRGFDPNEDIAPVAEWVVAMGFKEAQKIDDVVKSISGPGQIT